MTRKASTTEIVTASPLLTLEGKHFFEQRGQRWGAERTDADRADGDPDLHGGDVLVDVPQLLEGEFGAAGVLLPQHFQAGAA